MNTFNIFMSIPSLSSGVICNNENFFLLQVTVILHLCFSFVLLTFPDLKMFFQLRGTVLLLLMMILILKLNQRFSF